MTVRCLLPYHPTSRRPRWGSMDPLLGQSFGPYLLEQRLGSGGMAVVYRARHQVLEQTRAIKVMSNHLATHEGFVRLFYREAKLAAGLRHPNIVLMYDI